MSVLIDNAAMVEAIYAMAHPCVQALYPDRGPWEMGSGVYELAESEFPVEIYPTLVAHLYAITVHFPLLQHYTGYPLLEGQKNVPFLLAIPATTPALLPLENLPVLANALPSLSANQDGTEGLYAFLSQFCSGGNTVKFYFVPNGQYGPTTLQPEYRQDLLFLSEHERIHARHVSNSPWETWEVSLPKESSL